MSDARDALSIDGLLVHRRFVRALARALVRDEAAADDLEQETWLRACQSPPVADRGLRGWLKRVVRNAAGDARRSDDRRGERERLSAQPEQQPSTDAIAARFEIEKRLVAAVESLDERYRRVVFLRFFEDLPPRVAAKRLAIPVDTVRTQTARALEQLRKKLDDAHGGARRDWIAAMAPLALAPMSVAPIVSWAAAAVVVVALTVPAWQTFAVAIRPAVVEPAASGLAAAAATTTTTSPAPAKSSPPRDGVATVVAEPTAAASVSGTVVGSLRTPLADAEVELRGDYGSTIRITTRSDGAGHFCFAHVPLEYFWLTARRPGCVAAQRQLTVDVSCPEVTGLRLTLWEARAVHGIVVDAVGAPVKDAKVVASPDDVRRSWPITNGMTDEAGRFTLADVPLHPFFVSVFAAGHVPLRHQVVPAGANETRLTLLSDLPATLHVTLVAAPGVDLSHGIDGPIRLQITPLTESVATPHVNSSNDAREELELPGGSTSIDVPALAPGTYDVFPLCFRADVHPRIRRVTVAPNDAATVEIVVDRLFAPMAICGRVLDRDGSPVPRTCFDVTPYGAPARATRVVCDDQGSFSFVSATGMREMIEVVPDDPDRMFASDSAFGRRTHVVVAEGKPIDLTLVPCERLSGRIVDANDHPLAGSEIHLDAIDRPTGQLAQSHVAGDGRFELSGSFSNHPMTLWLYGDFGAISRPIDRRMSPGERRDDVIILVPRAARARGRVVDEDGNPVAGASVRAMTPSSRSNFPQEFWFLLFATAVTDRDGCFVLDSIQPSTTRIGIGADPGSTADVVEFPVSFSEGEIREEVNFTLPRRHAAPGRIRVRVEWDDGTPEPDALVFAPPTNDNAARLDRTATLDLAASPTGATTLVARYIGRSAQGATWADSAVVEAHSGGPAVTLQLKRPQFGRLEARLPDAVTVADLTALHVTALIAPSTGQTMRWEMELPWSLDGNRLTIGPMAAGHYDPVQFDGPAIRRFKRAVDVAPDRTTDVGLLLLEPLSSIETKVTDATGAPIGDAEFDEHADLNLPAGVSLSTRTTLQADEAGLIDVPGNSDLGVFRAPGFAPCQWHRSVNKPGSVVLLREGTLRMRDMPDEARTNPSPWRFAIEVRQEEVAAASYPRWLMYDAFVVSLSRDLVPHLPATRITVHFWKNDDVRFSKMPEQPAPGRYYRIDATLVADEVTDVSIAPGR